MNQKLVLKMNIPRQQLLDIGFIEIEKRLFLIHVSKSIKYYRDYRSDEVNSYAYCNNEKYDHEVLVIHNIVERIQTASIQNLMSYT